MYLINNLRNRSLGLTPHLYKDLRSYDGNTDVLNEHPLSSNLDLSTSFQGGTLLKLASNWDFLPHLFSPSLNDGMKAHLPHLYLLSLWSLTDVPSNPINAIFSHFATWFSKNPNCKGTNKYLWAPWPAGFYLTFPSSCLIFQSYFSVYYLIQISSIGCMIEGFLNLTPLLILRHESISKS